MNIKDLEYKLGSSNIQAAERSEIIRAFRKLIIENARLKREAEEKDDD